MVWTLNVESLRDALGTHDHLPTPEEFAAQIAQCEIGLLTRRGEIADRLLQLGWYLHAIASAWNAPDLYPIARRRQAFAISAQIFDLALQSRQFEDAQALRVLFAAQIGFARSSLEPNSIAARRRQRPRLTSTFLDHPAPAVDAASALLALDTHWLYAVLRGYRTQLDSLQADWETPLERTPYGSAADVVDAIWQILLYLTRGDPTRLETASGMLRRAVANEASQGDLDSRWVAAHLINALQDLASSSIWAALPPNVPDGVRRAFTLGAPPVMQLWAPQIASLQGEPGRTAASSTVKRMVMSMPTSAGKTLLGQILAVSHLATQGSGVCFVAPTRALCREIERSLRDRLRYIQRDVVLEASDEMFLLVDDQPPDVTVMTPERLAYLLRQDANQVLERNGLFIFDEVHNVADPGRGWTLESVITEIHKATVGSEHRVVLMSAALGNRVHFTQWIDPDSAGLALHFDWRGPRRLTAIYTAEAVPFDRAVPVPRARPNSPHRVQRPMTGVLRVRTPDGHVTDLSLSEPVGTLVTRMAGTRWTHDDTSTPFYKTLPPLINHLAGAGPVLVVCPTKQNAMDMAKVISESRTEGGRATELVGQVRRRLGEDHPLVGLVEKGVAYHHGSLPRDVQAAVEAALAIGSIDCVAATTTLTEGVNLPVRSVVISAQGNFGPGGYSEYITGARMMNAIGRAGRAARETEGWVVLARNANYTEEDFDRLEPSDADLQAISTLLHSDALNELAALEDAARQGVDVVFQSFGTTVDAFNSFVWQLCRSGPENVDVVIQSTLAWHQMTQSLRRRWLASANVVKERFAASDPLDRSRWAKAGFSLASARALDEVSRELVEDHAALAEVDNVAPALTILFSDDRLDRIMRLVESPETVLRRHRSAPRDVRVPLLEIVRDWVAGHGPSEIADRYMQAVTNRPFRLEQAADFLTSTFENYLPWAVGTLLSWATERQPELATPTVAFIPASLRYGVSSPEAAVLLRRGVASRSLANRVALVYRESGATEGLREWLAQSEIGTWPDQFTADPADVRDLLEFARRPGAVVLSELLEGNEVSISLPGEGTLEGDVAAFDVVDLPAPAIHLQGGTRLGSVPVEHIADLRTLLATGIPIAGRVAPREGEYALTLRLEILAAARPEPRQATLEDDLFEETGLTFPDL